MDILKGIFYGILCFGILLILTTGYTQQFSSDIVVEGPHPEQISKYPPALDIDSHGNIGILWCVYGYTTDTVKFVKSYDGGQTFEAIRIVDTLQRSADAGNTFITLMKFDLYDHPMVFYTRWEYPYFDYHHYKISEDGGITFPAQKHTLISRIDLIDFMFYDSSLSFLGICDYVTPALIMKKSVDGGLNYFDSVFVDTGNRTPLYCICTVKCENGDLLCFYSGQAIKQNSTYHSDIFYNRSTDMGASFSQQIKITSDYQYNMGVYAATYRNHVFLIYQVNGDTITPKIIFRRSDDNGNTFPYKKIVQDMGNVILSSHGEPFLLFHPNIGLCLIWTQYAGSNVKTWFTYSTDLGENFHPPVLVAEDSHWRWRRAMAVSDSGDVYVTRLRSQDLSIVLQKAKLPVLTGINSRQSVYQDKPQLFSDNYPNPFNENTVITFTISGTFRPTLVSLKIFDISGRKICTLLSEPKVAGTHQVVWNGNDDIGHSVASGVYVYRIQAGDFVQSKKLLFMK